MLVASVVVGADRPGETMSGDNLRRVTTDRLADQPDEQPTPLGGTNENRTPTLDAPDALPEALLSTIADEVAAGEIPVDDGLVTESLDEVLLALIAQAEDDTHGTGLMAALSRLFDADLSPGTVYPRLHDLEDDGALQMHELVQTKQYSIEDHAGARDAVESAAHQHLALGLFLQASLAEL